MEAITLEKQNDRLVISIDENYVDRTTLDKLIDRIKWEHLIAKADFDDSLTELGEQIKADWWAKNKARFLQKGE